MRQHTTPLSGNAVKRIACAAMLADHLVRAAGLRGVPKLICSDMIGRIAFPLFCLLLAEGFFHTRNLLRYLLRIGLLALISEPFFDRALQGRWLEFGHQNTVCLLCLGLLLFCLLRAIGRGTRPYRQSAALQLLAIALFAVLAELLRLDYGALGILALASCYYGCFLPPSSVDEEEASHADVLRQRRLLSLLVACLFLNADGFSAPASFLALIPAMYYSGRRGKKSPTGDAAFYLFYPLHLLVLALLFR